MDETRESSGHLAAIVGIGLLVIGFFVVGVIGVKVWGHQVELTRSFEQCMESAPFKKSFNVARPENVLSADQLQNHFEEFDRIVKATGLPPVWNGKTLVPWKSFHQDSIAFARQCHVRLGIDQPQRQLKGTYSKPVWDPDSPIWAPS